MSCRAWRTAAPLLIASALLAACSGEGQPEITPDPTFNPATQPVAVRMNHETPADPPFSGLAAPSALPPQGAVHTPSFTWDEQDRDASAYAGALPAVQVQPNLAVPAALDFSADWSGQSGLSGAAYCMYEFNLPDFGSSGEDQTLGVNWLLPAVQDSAWIGLGNFGANHWDWFEAPEDEVLTIDTYAPYVEAGRVLVAVVVLGTQTCTLRSLHVGQQETRGMGDLLVPDAVLAVMPPVPSSWPILSDKLDLSPGCSAISDQGQTGGCTAFANADSGFNYELMRSYGPLGWDFSSAFNRLSPRYVYNQTGIDLGGSVPYGGRSCGSVGEWLLSHGTATEQSAPTGSTKVPGYDTSSNWSQAALDDAALLRPDTKTFIGHWSDNDYWWTDEDIDTAMHVLKDLRHVIVFRVDVDKPFCYMDLSGNKVWNYSGPDYGGHAMCIVGYDTGKDGGKGAFKVRNSWSSKWGTAGYCWVGFDTFKNFDAGIYGFYFTEVCNDSVVDRFIPGGSSMFWPCTFIATTTFNDKIVLSWDQVDGATLYELYRDNQQTPFATLPSDVYEFADGSVMPGEAHIYWLRALDAQSQPSAFSNAAVGWLAPAG